MLIFFFDQPSRFESWLRCSHDFCKCEIFLDHTLPEALCREGLHKHEREANVKHTHRCIRMRDDDDNDDDDADDDADG